MTKVFASSIHSNPHSPSRYNPSEYYSPFLGLLNDRFPLGGFLQNFSTLTVLGSLHASQSS
jgi:hypothetical protein